MNNLLQIDPRDLLQLDGSIIIGILILLTISIITENKYEIKYVGHPRELIFNAPFPFIISASQIVLSSVFDFGRLMMPLSVLLTVTDFAILLGSVAVMLWSIEKHSKTKNNVSKEINHSSYNVKF